MFRINIYKVSIYFLLNTFKYIFIARTVVVNIIQEKQSIMLILYMILCKLIDLRSLLI